MAIFGFIFFFGGLLWLAIIFPWLWLLYAVLIGIGLLDRH